MLLTAIKESQDPSIRFNTLNSQHAFTPTQLNQCETAHPASTRGLEMPEHFEEKNANDGVRKIRADKNAA